ncbi:MAG: D-aminoacylase [Lachnospiraceae bacterium]|nr:D-aminoacylase [Lachnospiraceae bacterium]
MDVIIRNGRIIDGTGSPSYFADLGIRDGKIVSIGKNLGEAKEIIDAAGLTVTPGFIDSHSHSDSQMLTRPDMDLKIEQGITSSIAGQCGGSFVPLSKSADRSAFPEIEGVGNEYDLRTDLDRFFDAAKDWSFGSNLGLLIGHGTLRKAVMGTENRNPSKEELEEMKQLLRKGLTRGALGLSFGLVYVPGAYAKTEEAVELAKVVAEHGKIIAAHMRDERDHLVRATKEFLSIVKQSGARGVISHHKASMEENWGKVRHTLQMIDEANRSGSEVYLDVYPYTALHTSLRTAFIPKEDLSAGFRAAAERLLDPSYRETIRAKADAQYGENDFDWIMITSSPSVPAYSGKRISEIAAAKQVSPIDAVMDVLAENTMEVSACFFSMSEEDVKTVMAHPRAMICTDSGIPSSKVYHPRARASFPRALGKYVREEKVVTLPEMIRKMTAMPARVYGLTGKGLLREGMDADVCIFDENRIRDLATYENCHLRAEGLSYVLLGGEVVVKDAVFQGKRNGKLLLREE